MAQLVFAGESAISIFECIVNVIIFGRMKMVLTVRIKMNVNMFISIRYVKVCIPGNVLFDAYIFLFPSCDDIF